MCASAWHHDPKRCPSSKICNFLVRFLLTMRSEKNYPQTFTIHPMKYKKIITKTFAYTNSKLLSHQTGTKEMKNTNTSQSPVQSLCGPLKTHRTVRLRRFIQLWTSALSLILRKGRMIIYSCLQLVRKSWRFPASKGSKWQVSGCLSLTSGAGRQEKQQQHVATSEPHGAA